MGRGYTLPVFHLEQMKGSDKETLAGVFQILGEAGIQFVIVDTDTEKEKALCLYPVNNIDRFEVLDIAYEVADLYEDGSLFTELQVVTGKEDEDNRK